MKRKFFNPIVLLCCFFVVMAVIADLNGKWTGVIKTPDGNDLQVTYNFKVDGTKLTGTAESPAGTITVDGNDYPHSGKLYADSCGLDIDFGGNKVHTTLKRADK